MTGTFCKQCRHPVQGYPQTLSDYPLCWRELEEITPWHPPENRMIRICTQCNTLWLIQWDVREFILDAFPFPSQCRDLFYPTATPELFLDVIQSYSGTGLIESCLITMAEKRFKYDNLSQNGELLLNFLSDQTLTLPTAQIAVQLLKSLCFAGYDQANSESMDIGSPARDKLIKKIHIKANNYDNIVDVAKAAYEEWKREKTVQPLPPLRNWDLTPLDNWLPLRPLEQYLGQVATFRQQIRELLMLMANYATQKPPLLKVTPNSLDIINLYRDRAQLYQLTIEKLHNQVQLLPNWDEINLMDTINQLHQFLWVTSDGIDPEVALALATLGKTLKAQSPTPHQLILQKIDQILQSITHLDNYPTPVKQYVLWHLKKTDYC
ncbi:hypothetical protein PCC7418_3520 [Halothece sp. PCC 7418]|uniref:hypothetical protein n=1 Tax=Halothece sp. (strain PCC 7418) TaxID=65093 RepID=UPI0002A06BB5|nr:hypothetical protein [Halothece sp. PCC 7418]AFZ45631.1 hypothetical protein PCC7418_3520 [Halothece sp. PCC 7418]